MIGRRSFLRAATGALAWPALGMASSRTNVEDDPARAYVDGLAPIDAEYSARLLSAMVDAGLVACMVGIGRPLREEASFGRIVRDVREFQEFVGRRSRQLLQVRTAADFERAVSGNRLGVVLSLQNAAPLGEEMARLDELHRMGIRVMQLTHNTRNEVGDGYLEPTNAGLSRFGLDLVARMNELGMVVDLAHCGDATTDGAILFSTRPCLVSHAGCRALADHPRNKPDATLRALAQKGGVMGLFQITPLLGPPGEPALELYLRHLDHAINVAGIEHVGIGSDHDYRAPSSDADRRRASDELFREQPLDPQLVRGTGYVEELGGPRRMDVLATALAKRGRSAADIDKILGGNLLRLFRQALAMRS